MARIWMSGLEAGHLDIFDSQAFSPVVTNAQARTGTYSLEASGATDAVGSAFPANETEIFGRIGLRHNSQGVNAEVISLFDSVGGIQFTITLPNRTGILVAKRGAYNGTVIGVGGEMHQNRWHCIEFRLLVDNANGVFQLKVDGMLVINFAGNTQQTANANVRSFWLGRAQANGCPGYYDDIAFNDTSGVVNASWIGRGGIPAIFPTGAGFSTDLQRVPGGAEANWEDVDEVPPDDDTSYVFDTLIDDHDSYAASNLVATGTIAAVQWLARAKSDLVGNPEIARILRIGGVDHQGADIAIDADYDYYPEILDEDPEAVGAWLVAAVNGMELGVKIR